MESSDSRAQLCWGGEAAAAQAQGAGQAALLPCMAAPSCHSPGQRGEPRGDPLFYSPATLP